MLANAVLEESWNLPSSLSSARILADVSSQLRVVLFHGREAISSLYRYEIVLLARSTGPEIDPDAIRFQRRATLRIATHTVPAYRVLHGVITEAEEMHPVNEGMLFRVTVEPPLVRAAYRKRCRIFLDKTLRQILRAVLQGDPNLTYAEGATVDADEGDSGFSPAKELFTFRIADTSRFDSLAARPYVVQVLRGHRLRFQAARRRGHRLPLRERPRDRSLVLSD